MSRMPLYFKRGYPGHGPAPYRRLLRSRHAAWRLANQRRDTIERVRALCDEVDLTWPATFGTDDVRRALDGPA